MLYIQLIFKEVYGKEFEAYWYHELIVRVLWNVIAGKEKRVIIELAPRMGKTELAVRQFISYMQGQMKVVKNQYFTYGAELTEDTSVDIKTIMQSNIWKSLFNDVKFNDLLNKKANWKLKNGSEYFGTSIGGAATGKGSNITVIDDPLKAHDADSKAERDNAWKFIQNSVVTRLENGGAIVNIMQRLHEDDPVGRMRRQDGVWLVLSFPLINDTEIIYEYEDFKYVRKAYELLPNRNYRTIDDVELLKKGTSIKEFEKQYNQNVAVSQTGHFKKEDITFISDIDLPEQNLYIHVDTAESLEVSADDRAIAVVGWSKNDDGIEVQIVMDGKRGKWDVYGTSEYVIAMMMKYPKIPVYIEGAGGGITLEVVLKKEIQKTNAKLREKNKPLLSNAINIYKPNNKITKNNKIKYMTVPFEQHTLKFYKGCDTDFVQQATKEFLAFDPERKHNTDNCIDSIASTWLFAISKKTIIKTIKKISKRMKVKKATKWRGV